MVICVDNEIRYEVETGTNYMHSCSHFQRRAMTGVVALPTVASVNVTGRSGSSMASKVSR